MDTEDIICSGCGKLRRWKGTECLDNCPCLNEPEKFLTTEEENKLLWEEIRKLRYSHDDLLEALKDIVRWEPVDGDTGFACTYCDMGGSGYSSKGDGHHDDIRDVCPVFKAQQAIAKVERKC